MKIEDYIKQMGFDNRGRGQKDRGSGRGSQKRGKSPLPGTSEKDIQDSILEYLAVRGAMAWRNNTGAGTFRNKTGKERFVRFSVKGASDIFAIKDGHFYAIEVKKPDGVVSDDQVTFLGNVRRAGGTALVAYSLQDVENVI